MAMAADEHGAEQGGQSDVPNDDDIALGDEPAGEPDGLRNVAPTDRSRLATSEASGALPIHPADRLRSKATDAGDREPETDIWSGRTSWKHFAGRIMLWILGNVAVAVLLGILASTIEALTSWHVFLVVLVIVLLSGAWVVGRIALGILGCHYRLTTERLFIERGILSRTTDQTELIRVDDVGMHKSMLDRIFGLGTVAIMSTDATDNALLIEGISEPEKVTEAIRSRMRALRRRSLFVENL